MGRTKNTLTFFYVSNIIIYRKFSMRGDLRMNYAEKSLLFKSLGDPTRLEIVDMLSGGELCACKILERFQITQPTLSHHMKTLCYCGLVVGRKEGKWTYYSLVPARVQDFKALLSEVTTRKEDCREITYQEDCCQ